MPEIDEQAILVEDLEKKIDRLRALYQQYFMGIEKLEPTVLRKKVEREIRNLEKTKIRNTSLRFKLQQQIQRYNLYVTYWNRIIRQIEDGTYLRDVRKVQEKYGVTIEKDGVIREIGKDSSLSDLKESELQSKTEKSIERLENLPFFTAPPPPIPKNVKKVTSEINNKNETLIIEDSPPVAKYEQEDNLMNVYNEYIVEREKRNLPINNISYDKIKETIEKQILSLGSKKIEFKVIIKDGKPIIKAFPK